MYPKSLVAEFFRLFGAADTEKLLTVFAGTTLRIPSTKELEEARRNIAIYETLSHAKSAAEARRLGEALMSQHNISRNQVRRVYKLTRKLLRESKRFSEADAKTGQLKKKTIRVWRKSKRRM